jgi:hypothetical protein
VASPFNQAGDFPGPEGIEGSRTQTSALPDSLCSGFLSLASVPRAGWWQAAVRDTRGGPGPHRVTHAASGLHRTGGWTGCGRTKALAKRSVRKAGKGDSSELDATTITKTEVP